ncbi:hypothetical protein HUJ04_009531 [Dendroctonus ponderosae]|nr:hypothetical protein HUJ04_009531 [Dendroctonus ponderosae]
MCSQRYRDPVQPNIGVYISPACLKNTPSWLYSSLNLAFLSPTISSMIGNEHGAVHVPKTSPILRPKTTILENKQKRTETVVGGVVLSVKVYLLKRAKNFRNGLIFHAAQEICFVIPEKSQVADDIDKYQVVFKKNFTKITIIFKRAAYGAYAAFQAAFHELMKNGEHGAVHVPKTSPILRPKTTILENKQKRTETVVG